MQEIEVFILMDADGNFITTHDADNIKDEWDTHIGNEPVHPTRLMRIKLNVPLPVEINLAATVPAEAIPAVPVSMTVA